MMITLAVDNGRQGKVDQLGLECVVGVTLTDELDDGVPFAEKMEMLTTMLSEQFAESAKLEAEIKKNLAGLGYEL
ncbi:hypothetical protein [Shewanella sp. SM74]|uniref:hypothetical protein n=1 Tax=Shewanella sp. SM74 TaxID=2912807 RepID=UPI0021DAAD99|nr:hypothetical protein [Shewanella sp. SM74]MCU8014927.1 hypothetical protein [Shewanella sp. SM74]